LLPAVQQLPQSWPVDGRRGDRDAGEAGIDHSLFALAGRARFLTGQGVLMQKQFEGLSGHQADA
jgi:hypothetical protein